MAHATLGKNVGLLSTPTPLSLLFFPTQRSRPPFLFSLLRKRLLTASILIHPNAQVTSVTMNPVISTSSAASPLPLPHLGKRRFSELQEADNHPFKRVANPPSWNATAARLRTTWGAYSQPSIPSIAQPAVSTAYVLPDQVERS
jgi:hypothetical protein